VPVCVYMCSHLVDLLGFPRTVVPRCTWSKGLSRVFPYVLQWIYKYVFHLACVFQTRWYSEATRLCPNENMKSHASYVLFELARNATRNETIVTRFNVAGRQRTASVKMNITNTTFVVRLSEFVASGSVEVKVGLTFSGHAAEPLFFDFGCTWTEPPSVHEWTHILNILKKNIVVEGAGVKAASPVRDGMRTGRGQYLTEVASISKPVEDVAETGQCVPCPAGAICIKGMFVASKGSHRLIAPEWGSPGEWTRQHETGYIRLIACPGKSTRFPFLTTGIVDEFMALSMQTCLNV